MSFPQTEPLGASFNNSIYIDRPSNRCDLLQPTSHSSFLSRVGTFVYSFFLCIHQFSQAKQPKC